MPTPNTLEHLQVFSEFFFFFLAILAALIIFGGFFPILSATFFGDPRLGVQGYGDRCPTYGL